MSIPVRIKDPKKQPSKQENAPPTGLAFEQALVALDDACVNILEMRSMKEKDQEKRYWKQRLVNIANPVSLALMECKGPRHFHHHYRRKENDESVLQPVLEHPTDTLAITCRTALNMCREQMIGMEDESQIDMRNELEAALGDVLMHYTN